MRLAFAKYATSAAGKGVSEGGVWGRGVALLVAHVTASERSGHARDANDRESRWGICMYIERYMQIADMTI